MLLLSIGNDINLTFHPFSSVLLRNSTNHDINLSFYSQIMMDNARHLQSLLSVSFDPFFQLSLILHVLHTVLFLNKNNGQKFFKIFIYIHPISSAFTLLSDIYFKNRTTNRRKLCKKIIFKKLLAQQKDIIVNC